MKEKILARPGGKLLCSLSIKWNILYAAEGDLNGSVPALLQGEHKAWYALQLPPSQGR